MSLPCRSIRSSIFLNCRVVWFFQIFIPLFFLSSVCAQPNKQVATKGDLFYTSLESTTFETDDGKQKGSIPCGVILRLWGGTDSRPLFEAPGLSQAICVDTQSLFSLQGKILESRITAIKRDEHSFPEIDILMALAFKVQGKQDPNRPKNLLNPSISASLREGDLPGAIEKAADACDSARKYCGSDNLVYGYTEAIIGTDFYNSRYHALAITHLTKATEVCSKYYNQDSPILLSMQLSLAESTTYTGNADKGLALALEVAKNGRNLSVGSYLFIIARLGELYGYVGRSGKRLQILSDAFNEVFLKSKASTKGYDEQVSHFLNSLARAHVAVGQHHEAEVVFKTALNALGFPETINSEQEVNAAIIADNLAERIAARGNYADALDLNQQALNLFVKANGENFGDTARSREIRALILFDQMKKEEKIENLSELLKQIQMAIDVWKLSGKENPTPEWANAMRIKGEVLLYAGRILKLSRSESEMAKKLLDGARDYLNDSAAQCVKLNGGLGNESTIGTVLSLNEASLESGRLDEATRFSALGAQHRLKHLLPRCSYATREEINNLFGGYTKRILLQSASLGLLDTNQDKTIALANILNAKGRETESVSLGILHARDAILSGDKIPPKVRDAFGMLNGQRGSTAQIAFSEVQGWKKEYYEIDSRSERALLVTLQDYFGTDLLKERLKIESINQLHESLQPNEVFVDFVQIDALENNEFIEGRYFGNSRYAACVHGANKNSVDILRLGTVDDIRKAINEVRESITLAAIEKAGDPATAWQQMRPQIDDLDRLIWKPIRDLVGPRQRLIISPDQDLWLVPWSALPGRESEFLIEESAIELVVSGRDLIARGQPSKHKGTAPLVVTDPTYDLDAAGQQRAFREMMSVELPNESTLLSFAKLYVEQSDDSKWSERAAEISNSGNILPRFSRLSGTLAEAERVIPSLQKICQSTATVLSGPYAAEPIIRRRIEHPQILIFMTHGFALDEERSKSTGTNHPLLHGGLALAGCNNRRIRIGDSDGILAGLEVLALDLRGTELVVLSACETGLGKLRAYEGVLGLRQAFHLAGARRVIATLWNVNDESSIEVMDDLFQAIAKGSEYGDALMSAQINSIESHRKSWGAAHPYFWASSTITGPPSFSRRLEPSTDRE